MKKLLLLFFIFSSVKISYSQVGNSPYPIIFVHGLNSGDYTWNDVMNFLQNKFSINGVNRLHVVLNAKGLNITNYEQDVIIPDKNRSGGPENNLSNTNVYAINFQNFWNENDSDPRIDIYSNNTPGSNSNQSTSNQSAIFKQAYALKQCIKRVLAITDADKVILVGHSMGGLAIREYLQRINEYGYRAWWADSLDVTNGHHVAKVVTIGTPHLGSNSGFELYQNNNMSIPNQNSEAVRDLRISYGSNGEEVIAPYLFSNYEYFIPDGVFINYHNKDVNCNGNSTDHITGISLGTSFSPYLPLPLNIEYTYITSDIFGIDGDGIVELHRQWLHEIDTPTPFNISDTLLMNKFHWNETEDTNTIIRGLDEPDNMTFAYPLKFNKTYSGFITTPSAGASMSLDSDFYKVNIPGNGILTVTINGSNAGLTGIAIISHTGNVIVTTSIMSSPEVISCPVNEGSYFVRVRGFGVQNPDFNNYILKANFVTSILNNGLIAYYPFDNDANDYSGQNHHGSFQNSAHVTPGIIGNGVQITENGYINGNGGHVLLPPSLCTELNTSDNFTVSLWVKEDMINDWHGEAYIWLGDDSYGRAGIDHFYSPIDYSQNIDFFNNAINSEPEIRHPFNNSYLHNFMFYSMTYTNGLVRAYVNGNLVDEMVQATHIHGTNAALGKHWWSDGNNWSTRMQGVIDEVRIYNRTLTQTEIQDLYNQPTLETGLLAYYPFNENTNDESGNNNHGISYGAVLTSDAKGIPNSAYYFNGINNYISIPDLSFTNLETLSWHALIYPERFNDEIALYYGQYGQLDIHVLNNKVYCGISLSDNNWYFIGLDISETKWYSIMAVWNKGNYLKVYLNGQLSGQIPLPDIPIGVAPFHRSSIGAYNRFYDNPRPFKGKIDEIRVYNRELSQSEILSLFNSNSLIFQSNIGIAIQGFKNSIGNNSRDTITIQFRNSISPYSIVDSIKGILDSLTSQLNSTFNSNYIQNGIPYYIVVKHRNSIETWSALPQSFSTDSLNCNFKSSSSQAFGNNLTQVEDSWCLYSGDVNQDEVIDASDMSEVDNDAYNSVSGYVRTDLTGDDFVDAADMSIVDNNAFNSVSLIRP